MMGQAIGRAMGQPNGLVMTTRDGYARALPSPVPNYPCCHLSLWSLGLGRSFIITKPTRARR